MASSEVESVVLLNFDLLRVTPVCCLSFGHARVNDSSTYYACCYLFNNPTERLLSNIPLDKYIYLAVNYRHHGSPGLKISQADLNTPFCFATSQTHFVFYSCFSDQVDLAAIGFPLAPLLANLFMKKKKKKMTVS